MPKATIFRCCLCPHAAEMPVPRRPSRELKPHPLHGWLAFHGFPEHDAMIVRGSREFVCPTCVEHLPAEMRAALAANFDDDDFAEPGFVEAV